MNTRRKTLVAAAIGALVAGLVVVNPVAAQDQDRQPYVVLMEALPAISMDEAPAEAPQDPDSARAAKSRAGAPAAKVDPESPAALAYRDELVDAQQAVQRAATGDDEAIQRYTVALNGFATLLTPDEVAAMRTQKGVMAVVEDELQQTQTDVSPDFLGVDGHGEAWRTGLDGKGVVVGVIDTGIWPEHASFADDGSYTRPEGVPADLPCEFGQTVLPDGTTANDHNPDDAVFDCNNKLLGARDMATTYNQLQGYETYASARDADGHGTHTASTAAGNQDVSAEIFDIDRGEVSGIAPRASIIAYKGLGELGGYSSDLAGAIEQAVVDGVDVINYSIGSSTPSLVGPDDIAFLFAAQNGVHVATSNGNSGPDAETVGGPASIPWVTSVGANTHTRTFENTVTLGDGTSLTGVSITEAASAENAEPPRPPWCHFLPDWLCDLLVKIIGNPFPWWPAPGDSLADLPLVDAADLGNELCEPDVTFSEDITGKAVLCLRGGNARVEKSRAVYEQGGAGMLLYNPEPNMSLVTDSHWVPSSHFGPSEGQTVAAYIDATGADATVKIDQGEKTPTQGSVMADFSSRGPVGAPASADIIKPDVTAPGVNILAGNTPTPELGRPGQLFQSISGTSMSSPEVAGLMALLDQANPDWSPAAAKSALMTTARQDVTKEDAATAADPFDMGAGHVDPGKVRRRNSMFQPGIVYEADTFDYYAFLCGTTDAVVASTCADLVGAGYSTNASDLNLASIGVSSVAGPTTVTRTITNVSGRRLNLKARVDVPDGYTVDVSPARVKLAEGESATVEVTFTNESAPVGEWRFGALTWKGSGYAARSPIAVQGALFTAPDEVDGTGESGTVSFEVGFGYDGAYEATAHGLAADDQRVDSVSQDPDQTFDPSDAGNGATPIEFDLADTALFRFVLDQSDLSGPGAEEADLDLYLQGPDGAIIAESTAGGTAEIVELTFPDPGTYTMWVHGWQTNNQVLDFVAHSWKVPATAGSGNLAIDSAPTEATVGATETVQVSWTGAAAGTNLGAVLHSNADGPIGFTLVTVEN